MTSGVSATGSMSAASQQNMGFPDGGQLTNVFVKVGDRVEPGQVIATVDDFALRQTLEQQQGQLRSQQAALDRLINSPVADGAGDSLSQAQEILDKTRKQASEALDAAEQEIDNAERKLEVDKKVLDRAEDQLEADERACDDDSPSNSSTNNGSGRSNSANGGSSGSGSSGSGAEGSEDSDDEDGSTTNSSGSLLSVTPSSTNQSAACSAIPSDKSAVASAKQTVVVSKNAVDSAKRSRDSQRASGELSIANAEQSVVSARNNANSERSDRPFNIEEQRGAVVSQQAAVAAAQRDVDDATLRSPVAATVSAVNGVVGEYLAPSSGTSALAPGSQAGIPGVDSASAAQAAAGVGANPARPGGTQFLVLDNIDAFQVVVPFNESDAATISQNQKVNVAVDAVPDVTLEGTVLSVAPTGTAISGVVTYYVTIVVNNSDPRIKDGQTVRATVVTEELANVLTVPSAAVRQENGRSVVTVLNSDGTQATVPFEPGKVGADRTQVLSGLREGQQIVLPTPR
ncbi:HlyD family efflux transporter periplasmic adaptor subunit [Pseudonocardia sp. DSM 110487]|uniref:HlyD family efflux transporter periplasmic adaptor subunit n=1 Tax=Pseudonocardia sp. DSM 110487 TaxID=2865833 RepID=UPI001C69FE7B|nr:HlyD family efflux transporter periplasmic adaptor subunit [Pseudonocardia sp. DSM 110487]QYN36028.1 HlyD family efflux transporter periplasmic adaptor subunit [Pseudonocardia sp. DSM 110487]